MTIIRRPWTRQPQTARVNTEHPLAFGLRHAYTFAGVTFDAFTGRLVAQTTTFGTGATFSPTALGIALNIPNGGGVTIPVAEDWSGPSTTIAIVKIASVDSPWGVLWRKNGSSAQQLQVGRNDATDDWYFYRSGGAGLRQVTGSSIAGDIGVWRAIAVTNASQAISAPWEFFVDAVSVGSGSYTGDQQATGSGDLYLGGGSAADGAAYDSAVEFAAFLHYTRVLTVPELLQLKPLTYQQIFAPRRIIIPSPVAAGATPTISALSAINVTASSAQPRITYTF